MPTFNRVCENEECGHDFDTYCSAETRDTEQFPCPECGSPSQYRMIFPGFTRASYVDGQRAKSDKNWIKMKQLSKLKLEKANAFKRDDKERVQKEIDAVTGKQRKPRKRIIDQLK